MSSGFDVAETRPRGLRFFLLGPLEARRDGVRLDLGPPKQRAVLALLLLHANRVIPTDRLIDELWGERPPDTARSALQVYVAGLRKALGSGGATLRTRSPGYVLEVDPGALDVDRFEQLRAEARATTDAQRRAALLHEALDLWRDTPLGEFDGEPFAATAREQLEERRRGALEERVAADLALGRHAELVPELDGLVAEHPYREHIRGQLMLALYRSGRQADALAAYRAARDAFADGLGIEPGPELKSLERAVLEQDPSLDAPPRVEPTPPPSARASCPRPVVSPGARRAPGCGRDRSRGVRCLRPGRRIARRGAAELGCRDRPRDERGRRAGSRWAFVPARSPPIGDTSGSATSRTAPSRGSTWRDAPWLEPSRSEAEPRPGSRSTGGSSGSAHGLLGSVSRVDAEFGHVVRVTPVTERGVYSSTGSVATDATGAIWVVFGDGTLARLDRATGMSQTGRRPRSHPAASRPATDRFGSRAASSRSVQRFSPLSLAEIDSSNVGSRPSAIAVGFGDVWVASAGADVVHESTSEADRSDATISVDDGPGARRSVRTRCGSRHRLGNGLAHRSRDEQGASRRSKSVGRRRGSSSRATCSG